MGEKIYKYFSSDVLSLVFDRDGYCGLKCSFPMDYNDPFELFLGVDLNISTHLLATYREIIRELPQIPTTCFSKSPVVAPMWAHYAQNHSGFVLEFDTEILSKNVQDAALRDVTYKDAPDGEIEQNLARSAGTMKPRHALWLQQAVLHHAYFSKQTAWSYEQEKRLTVQEKLIEDVNGRLILFVPIECITSIIVGSRIAENIKAVASDIADENDLNWFEAKIGKSTGSPYFLNKSGDVYVFDAKVIVPAENTCAGCLEPIVGGVELCAWCRISDAHEERAARANPFRILDRYGILDKYFEDAANLERGRK